MKKIIAIDKDTGYKSELNYKPNEGDKISCWIMGEMQDSIVIGFSIKYNMLGTLLYTEVEIKKL